MFARLVPVIFVPLWATGFINAKWGLPDSEPFTFLLLRIGTVVPLFFLLALAMKRPSLTWPERRQQMITGIGTHGVYLAGIFYAIELGLPAGIAALIVGLQPLLTALATQLLLRKPMSTWQWTGMLIGLAGVMVVLFQQGRLEGLITAEAVTCALIALAGMTFSTLWQSLQGGKTDLIQGALWQYIAAFMLMLAGSLLVEERRVDWSAHFIGAWVWSVFMLSILAILLWLYMLRIGEAARVTQFLYLTPPVTSLLAWLFFDEPVTTQTMVGTALVVLGLYLGGRQRSSRDAAKWRKPEPQAD